MGQLADGFNANCVQQMLFAAFQRQRIGDAAVVCDHKHKIFDLIQCAGQAFFLGSLVLFGAAVRAVAAASGVGKACSLVACWAAASSWAFCRSV